MLEQQSDIPHDTSDVDAEAADDMLEGNVDDDGDDDAVVSLRLRPPPLR